MVYLDAVNEAELQKYKGQLQGKVVLLNEPTGVEEPKREISKRYTLPELNEMKNLDLRARASDAPPPADSVAERRKVQRFNDARNAFMKSEGVQGALFRSSWDGGLVRVMGQNHRVGQTFPVPGADAARRTLQPAGPDAGRRHRAQGQLRRAGPVSRR